MLNSDLFIKNIELNVFLGWPEQERQQEQTILIDLAIHFPQPPAACATDQLEDTLCYHTLIDLIRDKTRHQSFRLVEHLAKTIFQLIEPSLPKLATLAVSITKHPAIEGLNGGISFRYGNAS